MTYNLVRQWRPSYASEFGAGTVYAWQLTVVDWQALTATELTWRDSLTLLRGTLLNTYTPKVPPHHSDSTVGNFSPSARQQQKGYVIEVLTICWEQSVLSGESVCVSQKTHYYTGLASWALFLHVFNFHSSHIKQSLMTPIRSLLALQQTCSMCVDHVRSSDSQMPRYLKWLTLSGYRSVKMVGIVIFWRNKHEFGLLAFRDK